MPLPLPRLDNHTFDQLFDEGRLTLPRLAPGWTDHNYHDPGITLMDLFAWLVEMDMYRLDRTSPAAYRAFLRLVGIELRPPQVAETVVTFNLDSENDPIHLLQSQHPVVANESGSVKFQLARNLTVLPIHLTALLSGSNDSHLNYSQQNRVNGKRFPPFGPDPQIDRALYVGFDAPLEKAKNPTVSRTETQVSLYVWVNSPEKDHRLRQRLIEECNAKRTRMRHCDRHALSRTVDWRQHYSVRTQWEYYDKTNTWKPLSNVIDETRAFTLSGAVRFIAPVDNQHAKGGIPSHPDEYFIRCRSVSGYYECPPEIQQIAINAVPACHAVDITSEEKHEHGSGRAAQSLSLQFKPVVAGSVTLTVEENGKEEEWLETLNWDRIGPHKQAYVLSPGRGEILFGDGLHGRVPIADSMIRVKEYRVGGGANSNVLAGTLTKSISAPKATIQQPFAATSGADAELLEHAKGRAIAWLEEPRRAVTLNDFEYLALHVPGVPVARAHAIVDYDPMLPCAPALGSVTVVIVPPCARPIPEPGPDMLDAVQHYLEPRRTLTSELHVMSPSFITVAVQAQLYGEPEMDAQSLMDQAKAKLDAFFHPLTGGQDGNGWPIGRDVYRSEVLALLNSIPGVIHVDDVSLQVEAELEACAGFVTFKRIIRPGDVPLQISALLFVERSVIAHRLVEDASTEVETYIRSQRGWLKHRKPEARREEVTMVLRALPGVINVEEVKVSEETPDGLCENAPVCPNSLVISGTHQITVSGARKKDSARITKSPC